MENSQVREVTLTKFVIKIKKKNCLSIRMKYKMLEIENSK